MPEHRTQVAYPNQNSDTEILHSSRDHGIVPDTVKTTFNVDVEHTDKTSSGFKNTEHW